MISILYFENTTKNKEYDWLRKGLADMLITDIARSYQIQVVERESLEKIINEQKLAISGLMDKSQTMKIGKLLNVNKLIYGSYIILDDTIRIDAKITEVETGRIIHSMDVSGKVNDIFSMEKDLAEKILKHFHIKVPDELKVQDTNSLDALKTYYEGISSFDEGKADKALAHFQKAKDLDPLYLKPQKGLEAAYQFLKDFKKLRQQHEIWKLYKKVDQLRTRLESRTWKTYADIIKKSYASLSPEEIERLNEENSIYILCNTRAQCTWHLMLTIIEIGQKYREYFDDTQTEKRLCEVNFQIAEKVRGVFKGDPFLPEIFSLQLQALECLEDYKRLKDYAEKFLLQYPDYRLIESVEDQYERALNKLKEKTIDFSKRWESSTNIGGCGVVTLKIRDKEGKIPLYSALFIITASDKKQYKIEKYSIKADEFAEVSFPSDLWPVVPQSGKYSWECVVEGKTVSKDNFEYKTPSSEYTTKNVKTRAGELTIETIKTDEDEDVHFINLNGNTIRKDDLNNYLSFEKLFKTKDADVILLLEYTTHQYRLITVKADGSYQISNSFGDCSDVPKTQQQGYKIIIKFPKIGETVIYENEQVTVQKE